MSEPLAVRRRSRRDFRFLGCCVLALCLHALLLTFDLKVGATESQQQHETSLDAPMLEWVDSERDADISLATSPSAVVAPTEALSETPDSSFPAQNHAEISAPASEQSQDASSNVLLEAEPGSETNTPAMPAPGKSAPPKRLSLAQLGIGVGPQFKFAPAPAPQQKEKPKQLSAEERLQQSFTQSAARESQRLGLGITGEVKGALLRATQSAKMTDQGSALFTFTFGEGGELKSTTHSTLNGAASDWARVSALVKSTLQQKPAKLPSGTKGAQLSYAVDYSFVLPSGSKGGEGLKWSLTQSFDVADIGATKQASAKVTLKNYQVF